MVPERNVHLHKYSGCRDQLGIHSGSMAAVPDAEEDASGRRTSVQQRLYYALPVLVMGVIMLVMSLYKAIAFLVTGDESICVPVEKEGGGVLD